MGKFREGLSKNRKWWTLGTVCFALLMIVLDGNVVNLAVPSIMKTFNASIGQIEWVNNAYLLTFAILLITLGRLGDEVGRKKMFLVGLFSFIIGSFLCAAAPSINYLIAFRVIQGIGGAAMMPATLSLIAANFEKKERGAAMGIWGAVSGLGIVLGPILGGYLTEKGLGVNINNLLHITDFWRYVFYINIPVGILAIVSSFMFISESKDSEKKHKYDFVGIFLSSIAIFLLTFGFIEGAKFGWWKVNEQFILFGQSIGAGSISVIPFLFLLSILFIIVFVLFEKTRKVDPLVDMNLFKARNFSIGSFAAAVLSFSMMGSFFLLPLFLQSIMGFTAIKTGQVLLPFAITIMIMAPIAGRLADKFGGKYLISAGMAIMAIGGFYIGHFRLDTQINELILPFIIMGLGMGMSMSPLTNITLLETPEDEIGGASGVISTARQIGSVMGIAILAAFLQTVIVSNIRTDLTKIDGLSSSIQTDIVNQVKNGNNYNAKDGLSALLMQSMQQDLKNKAIEIQKANDPKTLSSPSVQSETNAKMLKYRDETIQKYKSIGMQIGQASKQSYVDGINKTFFLASLIALFGALVALLFKGGVRTKVN
ncbi:MAG: MFS transporter [Candidatus Berkelbacteria bacterium]